MKELTNINTLSFNLKLILFKQSSDQSKWYQQTLNIYTQRREYPSFYRDIKQVSRKTMTNQR
jgi:hypothetical protein